MKTDAPQTSVIIFNMRGERDSPLKESKHNNIGKIVIAILIIFFLGVLIVPPIVLIMIGRSHKRRGNPEKAKIFYIMSVVYLLIAGGTCYTILT